MRQCKLGTRQLRRVQARVVVGRERSAGETGASKQGEKQPSHASPPARSAFGGVGRGPDFRPSTFLYHVINAAAATIMSIPNALTRTCIATPSYTSTIAKWLANDKNTPRQKISSEFCPHRMAGFSSGEPRPGQSRGTRRTGSTASARKCAKRSTSRLGLSIGYIHSVSHFGTSVAMLAKYQVIAVAKARTR